MENNTLQHWGIKGMRWGLRRYQNADGSLTPAGKKRYNKEMEKLKSEAKVLRNKQRTQKKMDALEEQRKKVQALRDKNTDDATKKEKPYSEKPKKEHKNYKMMSEDELRDKIARLELEKKYRELSSQSIEAAKKKPSKFKEISKECVEKAAKNIGGQLITYMMGTATNAAFKSVFNEDIVNPKKGQKDK